jgi:TPR repeat protein
VIKIFIYVGLFTINLFAGLLTQGMIEYKKGNLKSASELYTKGCKEKNVYSCIELGKMYVLGEGVQLNSKKAKKIFKKACKRGYTGGCFHLGKLYYQGGNGVKQNKKKAKSAFGSACTYGHEQSCDMYRKLDNLFDQRIIEK